MVAFDDHAAKYGRIPVVKVDDIHLAGEFSRLGVIAALRGVAVAGLVSGLLIITGAACGRICAVVSGIVAFASRQADDHHNCERDHDQFFHFDSSVNRYKKSIMKSSVSILQKCRKK